MFLVINQIGSLVHIETYFFNAFCRFGDVFRKSHREDFNAHEETVQSIKNILGGGTDRRAKTNIKYVTVGSTEQQ